LLFKFDDGYHIKGQMGKWAELVAQEGIVRASDLRQTTEERGRFTLPYEPSFWCGTESKYARH